jgi:hypothetical protein
MTNEEKELASEPPVPPSLEMPTLLESLPPTDPSVLKVLEDARRGDIHFAMIGRVAARWAYLEAVIDTWLASFADVEVEVGICFTAQMIGPRPRIDAFIALVRYLGADKRWNDILDQFAKDLHGLAEQRNRAVHDVWIIEPTGPHRIEATARRKVRNLKILEPTSKLIALINNIDELCWRFDDKIASPIFSELHTLPEISRPIQGL